MQIYAGSLDICLEIRYLRHSKSETRTLIPDNIDHFLTFNILRKFDFFFKMVDSIDKKMVYTCSIERI